MDQPNIQRLFCENSLKTVGLSNISDKVAAVDSILGVGEEEPRKMLLTKQVVANPQDPRVASDLTCIQNYDKRREKRVRRDSSEVGDSDSTLWTPGWGICSQDTIVGSTALSREWSKHSISPVDQVNIVEGTEIDEIEALGSNGLYIANAYFQAALHQAYSWKSAEANAQKERVEMEKEVRSWEKKFSDVNFDLRRLREENERLLEEMKKGKRAIIDEYLNSEEFQQFVDDHDDDALPGVFGVCWERVINMVAAKHPGVVDPRDFPCPLVGRAASTLQLVQHSPSSVDPPLPDEAEKIIQDFDTEDA